MKLLIALANVGSLLALANGLSMSYKEEIITLGIYSFGNPTASHEFNLLQTIRHSIHAVKAPDSGSVTLDPGATLECVNSFTDYVGNSADHCSCNTKLDLTLNFNETGAAANRGYYLGVKLYYPRNDTVEKLILPEEYQLYEGSQKIDSTQVLNGLSTTCALLPIADSNTDTSADVTDGITTTEEPSSNAAQNRDKVSALILTLSWVVAAAVVNYRG